MSERTPIELLRAVIEEQKCEMPCDTLHELHGDRRNICNDRNCYECKIDALRKAADLVEAELDALKARALPDGMEWPRFEDGEPVRPGDKLLDKDGDWFEAVSFVFTCDWWSIRGYQTEGFGDLNDKTRRTLEGMSYGARVKRHAPEVLDADGVEIRVGDTVWVVGDAWPSMEVLEIKPDDDPDVPEHLVWCGEMCGEPLNDTMKWRIANQLTHRAPVLAADGVPLREGETVWYVPTPSEAIVRGR